jgi:hypothetical protein
LRQVRRGNLGTLFAILRQSERETHCMNKELKMSNPNPSGCCGPLACCGEFPNFTSVLIEVDPPCCLDGGTIELISGPGGAGNFGNPLVSDCENDSVEFSLGCVELEGDSQWQIIFNFGGVHTSPDTILVLDCDEPRIVMAGAFVPGFEEDCEEDGTITFTVT